MTLRDDICAEARRWLGTPWHHQGRVRGAGVDCIQLVVAVYAAVGLLQPGQADTGDYPIDWHLHHDDDRMLAGVLQFARPVEQPLPGDVALFRFGRVASHVGICMDDTALVLHAYAPHREVTITDLRVAGYLADRMVGYFTMIGATT